MTQPTLCAHVLGALQVVHVLERVGLVLCKLLLIVVLAGAGDSIKEDAALSGIAQVVDNGGDDEADASGGEDGEDADHDALGGRT